MSLESDRERFYWYVEVFLQIGMIVAFVHSADLAWDTRHEWQELNEELDTHNLSMGEATRRFDIKAPNREVGPGRSIVYERLDVFTNQSGMGNRCQCVTSNR